MNTVILIQNNRLIVNGETLVTHTVDREIGSGANGIVYLAKNDILKRQEIIKVWRAANPKDGRDKRIQAFSEAAKLANAHAEHAVQIYSAGLIGDVPYATMEYVDGKTLRQVVVQSNDNRQLYGLAALYLTAIENTSKTDTFHGDPHWSNVLVYECPMSKYFKSTRIKLCDFGTSVFSGHEQSVKRHWRLVEKCILKITENFKGYKDAKRSLVIYREKIYPLIMNGRSNNMDEVDFAKLHTAPLRDYLEYWSADFR